MALNFGIGSASGGGVSILRRLRFVEPLRVIDHAAGRRNIRDAAAGSPARFPPAPPSPIRPARPRNRRCASGSRHNTASPASAQCNSTDNESGIL